MTHYHLLGMHGWGLLRIVLGTAVLVACARRLSHERELGRVSRGLKGPLTFSPLVCYDPTGSTALRPGPTSGIGAEEARLWRYVPDWSPSAFGELLCQAAGTRCGRWRRRASFAGAGREHHGRGGRNHPTLHSADAVEWDGL